MGHISECSGILSSLCSLPEVLVGHEVSEIRGEVLPYAMKAPYSGTLFPGWALFFLGQNASGPGRRHPSEVPCRAHARGGDRSLWQQDQGEF